MKRFFGELREFGTFTATHRIRPIVSWAWFWMLAFFVLWGMPSVTSEMATRAVIRAGWFIAVLWLAEGVIVWIAWHYYFRRGRR